MNVVGVVGLGLIGGSIARGLSRKGIRVVGCDVPRIRRAALAARAVAATRSRVERVAAEVDVLVLAAPPRANRSLLRRVAASGAEVVVTDVSSVKGEICALARRLQLRDFVGGHPMAGSERGGFHASRPDLFVGHAWALVPGLANPKALRQTRRLVSLLEARPHVLDAKEHDRAVAFLSHVPQLVAWALDASARGDTVVARHRALAGPGFRDMTRLARSPQGLWREILGENAPQVERALTALRRQLKRRA